MHQIKTEQFLPITKEKAWDFFSSPKNLSAISPPELDFQILTPLKGEEIYEGMKIDYTVRPLFGIKVGWQTEICNVTPLYNFTDIQLKGPYKVWEHTHSFIEQGNGTLIKDVVNYEIPFGVLGKLVELIIVRNKIQLIFDYRRATLEKMFN